MKHLLSAINSIIAISILTSSISFPTFMFAQTADPISGGAGWVGAGLLGAVLAWLLLKHIPDKDKQIREMMTAHDNAQSAKDVQIQTIVGNNQAALKDLWQQKSATLKEISAASQKSIETVAATFSKGIETVTTSHQRTVENLNAHCQSELDRVFAIIFKRDQEMKEYRAHQATESVKDDLRRDRSDRGHQQPTPGRMPRITQLPPPSPPRRILR